MKLICIGRSTDELFLMNLIEQIKVNDVSIDGYQGTYYTESPEYVQVTTDADGKIVEGIRTDGSKHIAGDLTVDGSIYNEAFDLKVNSAIEEIEEIIGSAGDALTYFESIDNPEWLEVTTDNELKVLGGRDVNGKVKEFVGIECNQINVKNLFSQTISTNDLEIKNELFLTQESKDNLKDIINDNRWLGKNIAWYGTSIPAGSGNYTVPITGHSINAYLAYYGEMRRFNKGQNLPAEYPIIAGSLIGVDTAFNHCQGSSRIQRNLIGANLRYRCLSLMNTVANNLESIFGAYNIDVTNKTFSRNLDNTVGITTWFDSEYEQNWISFIRQVLGCISQSYEIRLIAQHLLGVNNDSYVQSILGTYYDDVVSMLSDIDKTITDFAGYLGDIDLVVLEHSVNDSVSISVPVDTDNIDTFAGAYSQMINTIRFYKPNMRIAIVANFIDFGTRPTNQYKAKVNDYLSEIAKYHCTPFIDMSHYSQVSWAKLLTCGYWDASGIWHDDGFEWSEDVVNDSYTTNATFPSSIRDTSLARMKELINPHLVDSVWCWESSAMYLWCADGTHPFSDKTGRLTILLGKTLAEFINSLVDIK